MSGHGIGISDDEVIGTGVGQRPLWTYRWAARKRPFFHPVQTPAGHLLTVDAPDDHPWHHGLWFAIKFVNAENFWEEYDDYGVLRQEDWPVPMPDRDPLTVTGELAWIRPDRETVVIDEHRRITGVQIDDEAYAIDFETELVPRVDVELDRTPFTTWGGYGGLTFRGRSDFHDTRLLLSDGRVEDRVLGEPAAWLDVSGYVGGDDGDAPAGLAILDDPSNPRHNRDAPLLWYASTKADTYGDDGWSNFVNAAFLWDGSISVAAGDTIRFNYRVLVHDGIWDHGRVQAEHDRWSGSGFSPPYG